MVTVAHGSLAFRALPELRLDDGRSGDLSVRQTPRQEINQAALPVPSALIAEPVRFFVGDFI